MIGAWLQAAVLAAVPWVAEQRPWWTPALVAAAVVVVPLARRTPGAAAGRLALVAGSCALYLVVRGGWMVAGGWLLLAAVVAAVGWSVPFVASFRVSDLVALVGWATAFLLRPELVEWTGGGWLAPSLLLLAVRRLVLWGRRRREATPRDPDLPSRLVRGTLSLRGVVLAGSDRLPRSIPIDLELRAGESLAVVCDVAADGEALCAFLTGRRAPLAGEMAIDGVPPDAGDRLVAVVAEGERFVAGDLEENVVALCLDPVETEALSALYESCSLAEVSEALGDRVIDEAGEPLSSLHRLLVLVARVIPSTYRVLVVHDPMPWVNAVRREIWRSAVVRASVGRTAVWITADRQLASRASVVMELRQGALRPLEDAISEGGGPPA